MFNWRDWSGRNAELARLRQEKRKQQNLVQKSCTNNTHFTTTSSTSHLTTKEREA